MNQRALYRSAVIVHAANSLSLILFAFPALMTGPSGHTLMEGVPQAVIVVISLIGVAGLISAYGAWQYQKWGVALTIITEALNGILALPAVLVAPSEFARVYAIVDVLVAIFVIVVMLRRPRTVSLADDDSTV